MTTVRRRETQRPRAKRGKHGLDQLTPVTSTEDRVARASDGTPGDRVRAGMGRMWSGAVEPVATAGKSNRPKDGSQPQV
jgi:hypothetical protein